MLKNKLIILPIDGSWNHSADFLRQTAITLSKYNKIIIYDQNNSYFFLKKVGLIKYPNYKNIHFHRVRYFLPFRRAPFIEKVNRRISFWLFLQKYKKFNKILWVFYPNYFDLAKAKNKKTISIYDCVDYSEDKEKEKKLIKNVNYFFVNSKSLEKLHRNKNKKPIYINSQGFFKPNEKKIKKITLNFTKPIIGFVGGINYRLDFYLLNQLIKKNQHWQFILYGPLQKNAKNDRIYKTAYWLEKLKKHKNVEFKKSNDRYEVYGIIKNFDVAIIPYNIKVPFNRYCYPMKIFEYFYFGKNVISTKIREFELNKFKNLVIIANDTRNFEKAIIQALNNKNGSQNVFKKKQLALENSWDQKLEKISRVLSN